ncbi:MAG TPA: hypothetical protein VLH16_06455 [Bacteroidales bacterium]|nr:hypothetical protein [Bacteroidales bacterium]
MNLTEEQIKEIEELAGLFLEADEIAVLTNIDIDVFNQQLERKKGDIYLAYLRGKTVSKREIHQNVVKMAKHGSPQAEELANILIDKQKMAEKRARK